MVAAIIGKIFLEAYNDKFSKAYNAKSFFIEKYYPLFFDHDKYMQWITNSPFVQGIKKGIVPTQKERQEKLQTLVDKIRDNNADASIAIGFPSLDLTATTSGQVTNLKLPISEDDVYLSWIGSGFGIGVQGGISIFFYDKRILLSLYDGWQIYRNYLNQMPNLRGNQINTWNGQWLAHCYGKSFFQDEPLVDLNPFEVNKDGVEIFTQSWTMVLVAIARRLTNPRMIGYVYNLGQTNTTIGFIPFILPEISKVFELYEKLFGIKDANKAELLFGTAQGLLKSCQMGAIGVEALEPKGIRAYFAGEIPSYNGQNEEKRINFNIYQTWILAMLNNDELWTEARKIALLLYEYTLGAGKAKTDRKNDVKSILKSTNKKNFIDNLELIVEEVNDKEGVEEIGKLVHMMPNDNVTYFLTLIRFQYAVVSNVNKN